MAYGQCVWSGRKNFFDVDSRSAVEIWTVSPNTKLSGGELSVCEIMGLGTAFRERGRGEIFKVEDRNPHLALYSSSTIWIREFEFGGNCLPVFDTKRDQGDTIVGRAMLDLERRYRKSKEAPEELRCRYLTYRIHGTS